MRLSLPEDALTELFASSRGTIRRVIAQTRQLLDQHDTAIEPVTLPVPLTDLITKIKAAN
jgi:hypothetical protein